MKFIKEDPLYNWGTNDPASLYINHTSKEPEPPKEFACTVIGHSGILRPATISVQTADLEFLGAGLFGPPRDKSEHHGGWTGDAYKFGVYAHLSSRSRHHVVILRTDGGGFYSSGCEPDGRGNVATSMQHVLSRNAMGHLFLRGSYPWPLPGQR